MTIDWVLIAAIAGLTVVIAAVAIGFYLRTLYSAPWFLLVGPAHAGKTALVAGALETAFGRQRRSPHADNRDVAWHYFQDGVVIDVAGPIAFPAGGTDTTAWQRLLRALKRYRPRRPIDGIILAVPAPLLLEADWAVRTQDLGAAVRERLTQAQNHFGFALPVYVVITQSDRVRGFTAFARALPENLTQNMLGWSNPHAADLTYAAEWIGEGFGSLHRSLVRTQLELFALGADTDDASGLFLFSGEVGQLATPLNALLEEVFRPSLYHESFFFRGFYLSGEGMPRRILADLSGDASALTVTSFHAAPNRAVNFIGDLLDQKVFPERGLAAPLPDVSLVRHRGRLAGQIACVLLLVGLTIGTAWSYRRFRGAQNSATQLLAVASEQLTARRQLQRNERSIADQDRLGQSRTVLERLQEIGGNRFSWIFMPASLVAPIEPALSGVVTRVFGDVVLEDFRTGLEHRGRDWLAAAIPLQPGDAPEPAGPDLKDSARYQALERFAQDYQRFVENYRRYDQIARLDGAADLSAPSDLLAYLTGTPLGKTGLAPDVARAVKAARAMPIACDVFEVDAQDRDSLVGQRASDLLRDFGARSFGRENPVLAAAGRFSEDWDDISQGKGNPDRLASLIKSTATLSQAVTAWAALGGRSTALRTPIAVFAQPPFKQLAPIAGFCAALRPDLSEATDAVRLLKDRLAAELLTLSVEPFGALISEGPKGLELNAAVAMLKVELDDLQHQPFWLLQPVEVTGALPATPIWRPEAIDEAVKAFDAFDSYRGQGFSSLMVSERRQVFEVVRSEVAQLIATRLALTAAAGAPPSTADQITPLGVQLTKIGRLVPLLAMQSPFGRQIVNALDLQARSALQEIDRAASTRYPSMFVPRSGRIFTAWADVQKGGAAADVLKRWIPIVDEQRDGARQLALQAQPIAAYLASRDPSELVRRWTGIAADVANYDQKRPDTGLAALDAAIRDVIPAIVPEKDCSLDGAAVPGAGVFITVRNAIVEESVRRCRAVIETRYAAIADAFNRLLSARFPFSRDLETVPEATPAQAAEFLRVYDAQSGRSLRQALEARSCADDAVTFIRRMDTAYALIAPVRDPTAPGSALDVLPEFRAARDQDNGGDQILQWQMDVGRQSFRESVAAKPAPWVTGDPINVTLRFARDSPNRPIVQASFPRVEDRTVSFEFRGSWALFELLRRGRAAAAPALRDARPPVLGLTIDVRRDPDRPPLAGAAPQSPFKVYLQLRLFQSGKTEPLPVDDFPTEAPLRASCPG